MRARVLVVGGGAMGLATARALAQRGEDVLLLDPLPTVNELNGSNDESKFFRVAYGADEGYARLALDALPLWRALEEETGARLLATRGLLLPARRGDAFAEESERVLRRLGAPVERWEREDLARRAPAWAAGGFDFAVLDGSASLLDPRPALRALETSAAAHGARIVRGRGVASLAEAGAEVVARLEDGAEARAEVAVVAAGAYAPALVPALAGVLRVTRQTELFFAPTADGAFSAERFPLWARLDEGYYGFPEWNGAVKLGDHRKGEPADPALPRGEARAAEVAQARAFLAANLPALAAQPLVRSRVCLYDNSPDDDFLLGRISQRVVLASGFSGHGIKFAPAVGRILADLAQGRPVARSVDRFAPARFAPFAAGL